MVSIYNVLSETVNKFSQLSQILVDQLPWVFHWFLYISISFYFQNKWKYGREILWNEEEKTLTTPRRMTCIHVKLFLTVKRRTCIHVLRHYFRNSYYNFGRHAIFSESSGSRLGDPGQKALQTTIEPTLFVDMIRPARNVSREIFLHRQEGFCVGKFGHVVDQAMLDNWPLRKNFRRSRLHY